MLVLQCPGGAWLARCAHQGAHLLGLLAGASVTVRVGYAEAGPGGWAALIGWRGSS